MLASVLLIVGLVAAPSALPPATVAMADPGDIGVEGPSHVGTGSPTGTKRVESVLWFNDGYWWGILWDTDTSDFHIFRFDAPTQTWVDTNVAADIRGNVHHDVLWDGTTLYVASNRFVNDELPAVAGSPSELRTYSYTAATDTYTWLSTTQINNFRTETLVVDKDSTGRLWATWQQGNRIFLNATSTDGRTWGVPFAHPSSGLSNVSVDDISAIVAFGPGKIGLMWSRQVGNSTDGFYWSVHNDGDPTETWSAPSPVSTGLRSGDDHLNLKWLDSSGGRVFAAVKTEFTSSPDPLLQLLALTGPNTWSKTTIARVSECPNRVLLVIDEAEQRLRTFGTYPKPSGTTNAGVCSTTGGAIYEKSTPLDNISFTTAKTTRIVDADQYVHNVTSTKQNVNNSLSGGRSTTNSGLLVLADVNATKRYWHYYEGPTTPGDTTPPTVTATAPPAGATGVAVDASVAGTFSEPMNPSSINGTTVTLRGPGGAAVPAAVAYDGSSRTVTLDPNASLANDTTYTATIAGGASGVRDSSNNALAADATWSFTTVAAPGDTTPPTVTATAPPAGATGVAVDASVTATFSEPMNPTTINGTTVTLRGPGGAAVPAAVAYDGSSRTVTLDPNASLANGTTYTATIAGGASGVRDSSNNALAADATWSFTTVVGTPGGTEDVVVTTSADSYVSAAATGTNFGTSIFLGVDASPVWISYLKFDLSPYAGRQLVGATLKLRVSTSGSTGAQNVKPVADDTWTETGLTYTNRPTLLGTVLGSVGPTARNTDYNIALNPGALAPELGGVLSLGLDSTSSDGIEVASRETATGPTLVLTLTTP